MADQDYSSLIRQFWLAYLETLAEESQPGLTMPEAWAFGRGEEMADRLGGLVVAGIKTATASLLWEYEAEGEAIPQPGDLSIILDGRSRPLCLIKTTVVEVLPFNAVGDQFAYDEGEGDRSLAYWRQAHWWFFGRTCTEIGKQPAEEMLVVCERFKLIFQPKP